MKDYKIICDLIDEGLNDIAEVIVDENDLTLEDIEDTNDIKSYFVNAFNNYIEDCYDSKEVDIIKEVFSLHEKELLENYTPLLCNIIKELI